jgi:hypothetical protein
MNIKKEATTIAPDDALTDAPKNFKINLNKVANKVLDKVNKFILVY